MHFKLVHIVATLALFFAASCNNPCRKLDCQNEGFCNDGECICQKWFAGEECELKFNRNYTGTYYGIYEVENGVQLRTSDSLHLKAGDLPNELITEKGLSLHFESDTTLLIPEQTSSTSTNSFEYQGSGVYRADYILIEYTERNSETGVEHQVRFEGVRIRKDN
ncbi:MAG: hypothetical protein HQ500_05430 [Flavobacteriales bacterium]|nr:hypothetical protein [Flavobacteriales bacterium]